MLNNGGSGTGISPTLKDFLLPIYKGDDAGEVEYKKSHFLQTARTLCDLGFFAKHHHLSDDALILEIIGLSIDCDRSPETLFLEGNYWEMLEVDTERILCCPSLEEWKKIRRQKTGKQDTLLDKNSNKRPEHTFDTLLDSLGKLSKISRGKFVPENIVELDPNCIEFDLEGKIHNLTLNGLPYEPSSLAVQINPIISEIGYQFELLSGYDVDCKYERDERYDLYIILLSEKEKQNLANKIDDICDHFWLLPRLDIWYDMLDGEEPPDYSFEILLDTLVNLSRISRGKFIFQNIVEIEKNLIQFNLNQKTCSLAIKGPPDDPWILAGQINPMIADTGYQFESCSDGYPDEFMVFLSEDEKQKIIDKKGLTLENCWEHYQVFFNY
ncbi:hypothetical protein BI308_19785 [Roseofilum reptotaenium AO1-A]|uniref:Uncharacterized protein n=2 Tax=Roseofilum TaxID=1233426 RepID=A0A1L9QMF6_9CYAN|nr:hypothetical protein BI308_19785 [Roseofilum reptotaenium AO1-A]